MLTPTQSKVPSLVESDLSFLKQSVKICIIDDDPVIRETYAEILGTYPLYSVSTCSSGFEADKALSSRPRIHVCIMDLGLTDIHEDELYLVKKFSPRSMFIVLTASDSIEAGFRCGKHGAFSLFRKPVEFGKIDFINTLNEAFIYSLVNTGKDTQYKPIIEKILEALLICCPANIHEWAYNACITEQYLRRIWNTFFGYQPRYFLWFFKMMTLAFSMCNKDFLEKFGVFAQRSRSTSCSANNDHQIITMTKYFSSQKDVLDKILNPS